MAGPVRMCVGCRGRADKAALLRLVWSAPDLVVDERQIEPGRGAYLHRSTGCVAQAVRRRAVGRALRTDAVGSEQVEQAVSDVVS